MSKRDEAVARERMKFEAWVRDRWQVVPAEQALDTWDGYAYHDQTIVEMWDAWLARSALPTPPPECGEGEPLDGDCPGRIVVENLNEDTDASYGPNWAVLFVRDDPADGDDDILAENCWDERTARQIAAMLAAERAAKEGD